MPSSGNTGAACCTAWPVPSCGSWRTNAGSALPRAWRPTRHRRLDLARAIAGDDDDAPRVQRRHAVDHMLQQCAAGQTVQHFGQAALHARALARRHDDHIDCCHALSLFPDAHRVNTWPDYRSAGRWPRRWRAAAPSSWATTTWATWPTGGWTATSTSPRSRRTRVREELARCTCGTAPRNCPGCRRCCAAWKNWRPATSAPPRPALFVPQLRERLHARAEQGRARHRGAGHGPGDPSSCCTWNASTQKNNADFRKDWLRLARPS